MDDKYLVWTSIHGKKFPLCLTIGAADELEKKFGSVDAASESVVNHANADEISEMLRGVLTVLRPLANAGKSYLEKSAAFLGEKPEKLPELPPDDVLLEILTGGEIVKIWADVVTALRGGSSREVEVAPDKSPKNAEAAM